MSLNVLSMNFCFLIHFKVDWSNKARAIRMAIFIGWFVFEKVVNWQSHIYFHSMNYYFMIHFKIDSGLLCWIQFVYFIRVEWAFHFFASVIQLHMVCRPTFNYITTSAMSTTHVKLHDRSERKEESFDTNLRIRSKCTNWMQTACSPPNTPENEFIAQPASSIEVQLFVIHLDTHWNEFWND